MFLLELSLGLPQGIQLGRQGLELLEGFFKSIAKLGVHAIIIQIIKMTLNMQKRLVGVLTVKIYQKIADGCQLGNGDGRIVGKCAATARPVYFTPEEQAIGRGIYFSIRFLPFLRNGRLKKPLDYGHVCSLANHVGIGSLTQ